MAKITRQVDQIRLLDGTDLITTVTIDDDIGNQSDNYFEIRVNEGAIARMPFRSLVFWLAQQVIGVPVPPFIDVQGLYSVIGKVPTDES